MSHHTFSCDDGAADQKYANLRARLCDLNYTVSDPKESQKAAGIVIFHDLAPALKHFRIEQSLFERMFSFGNGSVLVSMRTNDPHTPSNRPRLFKISALLGVSGAQDHERQAIDPKTTGHATKTNFPGWLSGLIPRALNDRTVGVLYKNPDNNFPGAFHESATDLSVEESRDLQAAFGIDGQHILQIKKLGNLICFSEQVDKYELTGDQSGQYATVLDPDKPGQCQKNIKHFIQATEQLNEIFYKILESKLYKITRIKSGCVYFTDSYLDEHNILKERAIERRIDLKDLIPTIQQSAVLLEKIQQITNEQELCSLLSSNMKLLESSVPMWSAGMQHDSSGKALFVPSMVHSGAQGFVVSGDADSEHIAYLPGLPASAYASFYCKNTSRSIILEKLGNLKKNLLSVDDYVAQQLQGLPTEDIPNLRALYKQLKDHIDEFINKCSEPAGELWLRALGGASAVSLVMVYIFKHFLVVHGPEDLHPMAKPESFAGDHFCLEAEINCHE